MKQAKWQQVVGENGMFSWLNLKTNKMVKTVDLGDSATDEEIKSTIDKVLNLLETGSTIIDGEWIEKDGTNFYENKELAELSDKEADYISIYEGVNGNNMGGSRLGYISADTMTWFIFRDSAADKLFKELEKQNELFKIHDKFWCLLPGWRHSDGNRFCDILRTVGYERGVKWLNVMLDWIEKNREHIIMTDILHGAYGFRTHGDDKILNIGNGYSYKWDRFLTTITDTEFEMKITWGEEAA